MTDDIAKAIAFFEEEAPVDSPPPPADPSKAVVELPPWEPDLNPTQRKIFDDPAENVLGHGEKGTGKSIGFGHKIIRHAYENDNALVLIITPTIRTGNEGIWHDIDTLVLPAWEGGIGLEFTSSKLDPLTKDRHRWIRNRFGGWSKLLLMSITTSSLVEDRVKGPAPSMVYVDELTNCNGPEYHTYPAAQLGRRRGIEGPQQFCASCNPEGPSHWVYQTFFVDCVDEAGKRDKNYSVHHVPIKENLHRLPPGYIDRLNRLFKSDPTAKARLIDGEWIDRPTGEGMFKMYYQEALHIKGNIVKRTGIHPIQGFPCYIGYDLGQVYSSISFLQLVLTRKKNIWLAFDEVDHLNERVLYKSLAWEVIEKMRYWRRLTGFDLRFIHITDDSAVNQWRPGSGGSYDAWDFEREFNRVQAEFGGQEAKLIGCPKGDGSVAARVRLLQSALYQEEFVASALCPNIKAMLLGLESDPQNPDNPKRSKHVHKFDSLTYPMFWQKAAPDARFAIKERATGVGFIRCGGNE